MDQCWKVACEFPPSALIYPEPWETWLKDEQSPIYHLPFSSLEPNRTREAPRGEAFSKGVGMVWYSSSPLLEQTTQAQTSW